MFALLCLLVSSAFAGSLAGVTLPDSAAVGGQSLVLNGLGLREKYYIDVYVGALYLPAKTTSGPKAVSDDVPKRIVMHFVYSEVPKEKMAETFMESVDKVPNGQAAKANMAKVAGWMDTLHMGDEVVLDYVPGTGTTVTVKGVKKGTIAGKDFMEAVFNMYVGPNPATADLKRGMLGG